MPRAKENLSVYNFGQACRRCPRTGHEGPEGEYNIALLFFNLGARWGGWSTPCPGHSTPAEETHCTGGWVGPAAGLNSI